MIGVKNIQGDGKYVGLLTQVTALQFYSTLLGILALALKAIVHHYHGTMEQLENGQQICAKFCI